MEREKLYTALSRVAWAYVFIYINFNLGTLNVLPPWVGYALILSALPLLKEERRDLPLLRPLGELLLVWDFCGWLLLFLSEITLESHFLFWDLLLVAANLYFHFQLFTDLAAIAARYQGEGDAIDKSLLTCRTWVALITTVTQLALRFLSGDALAYFTWGMGLVVVILLLCILPALFSLRKLFAPEVENTPETEPPVEQ